MLLFEGKHAGTNELQFLLGVMAPEARPNVLRKGQRRDEQPRSALLCFLWDCASMHVYHMTGSLHSCFLLPPALLLHPLTCLLWDCASIAHRMTGSMHSCSRHLLWLYCTQPKRTSCTSHDWQHALPLQAPLQRASSALATAYCCGYCCNPLLQGEALQASFYVVLGLLLGAAATALFADVWWVPREHVCACVRVRVFVGTHVCVMGVGGGKATIHACVMEGGGV